LLAVADPGERLGTSGHQVPLAPEQFQGLPRPEFGLGMLSEEDEHLDLAEPAGDELLVQFEGARIIPQRVLVQAAAALVVGLAQPLLLVAPRLIVRRDVRSLLGRLVEFQAIEPWQGSPPGQFSPTQRMNHGRAKGWSRR